MHAWEGKTPVRETCIVICPGGWLRGTVVERVRLAPSGESYNGNRGPGGK